MIQYTAVFRQRLKTTRTHTLTLSLNLYKLCICLLTCVDLAITSLFSPL